MTVTPEILMAYAEGELEDARRAEVESAIAANPTLAAELDRHRALRARLAAALCCGADEPGHSASPPRTLRELRTRAGWPQLAAMAACLVAGFLVAGPLGLGSSSLIRAQGRRLIAHGQLAHALQRQLASDPTTAAAPIRIGLTYRTREGDYCRTFTTNGRTSIAGVACREVNRWQVKAAVFSAATSGAAGSYRNAGAQTPQAIMDAMAADIDGAPLDARGEAAAKAAGWRSASSAR